MTQGAETPQAEVDPRQAAMAAIDDLLWTRPHNQALRWRGTEELRSFTGDMIIDGLTFTYVEHEYHNVEFALAREAILNIKRRSNARYFLGKALRPRLQYEITADNTDLAFKRFPDDTPRDKAPDWGYERWEFDTKKPNILIFYGRQRRYDHYEEHGGPNYPITRDGKHGSPLRFDNEFSNILKLVEEAKKLLLSS